MLTRRLICLFVAALCLAPPVASASHHSRAAALAQERYYSTFGANADSPALAQERYYSSYGAPETLSLPQTPSAQSGDSLIPIAAIALALAASAAAVIGLWRLRVRRRAAAVIS